MRILLPLVAALVPALILPGWSFYFDVTPKAVVLLIGVAVALLAWQGSVLSTDSIGRRVAILFVAQIAWLAVAATLSTHPALSFNGGNWRRFGFLTNSAVLLYALLVLIDCSGRVDRVLQYLRFSIAASVPIALYGIAQYSGYDPWLESAAYHAGEGIFTIVRPPSTLGHASYFGSFLVYMAFAGCALAAADTVRWWRLTGGFAAAISALAILLSGTRGAMAGLAAGLIVLAFRIRLFKQRWRLTAAVGVVAILLAALYFSPAGAGMRSRMHWSLEEPLGGARPLLWRDSLSMILRKPIAGYGPETFGTEFPRFQSIALSRAYPDFVHESPHNVVLDASASQGIPGLLLLLATAGVTFLTAWKRNVRRSTLIETLAAAMAGGLVAQQFTSFTIPTAMEFYLMAALIAAIAVPSVELRKIWWLRIPAGAFAVLFVAAAVQLAIADRALASTREALSHSDLTQAISSYETARRFHPAGSSSDLYFSRELANLFRRTPDVRLKLRTWTPAFQSAARAAGTDENRQDAFYNLAIFLATQNDPAAMERSLRNAVQWAPNWFKPHWALARLFWKEGRLKEARQEAEFAVELNGGKDAEVAQTLTAIREIPAR